MKRILSFAIALLMVLSMVPAVGETGVEYIPAPYTVAEGAKITDVYFEPVIYENENGPDIGVTLLGVLKVDGRYFRDSDNDHELDVFEDWRLDAATRAADLAEKLTARQKAAFIFNNLYTSPVSKKLADATNEDGTINPAMVMTSYSPDEGEQSTAGAAFGLTFNAVSDFSIIDEDLRHGVYRGGTQYDASIVALFNNVANTTTEYDAILEGNPVLPFTLISNPIGGTGYVGSLGLAAAVMGDVANGGDYSLVAEYVEKDREMWVAQGIRQMYGPQIDLVTDPRWCRNSGTFGEVPEVVAGITTELVKGYQAGSTGLNIDSVSLSIKHFPGDGAAENGYESHSAQGQWRIYSTPGSLEKYQLVGFQAACDAGVGSVMPCYSRDTTDARSVEQTYRGVVIPAEEVGSAYSTTMMKTLLVDAMGFKGFIQTDSSIVGTMNYGMGDKPVAERYAKLIKAGVAAIGEGTIDTEYVLEALETGLITEAELNAVSASRLTAEITQGRLDNPYTDHVHADEVRAANTSGEIAEGAYRSHQKSIVLLKNKNNVLPMNDTSKKVYIASFTAKGENEATIQGLAAEFTARGFTVVEDIEDADIAYLDVQPTFNGSQGSNTAMGVLDLVEELEMPRLASGSQEYIDDTVDVTTLEEVDEIAEIAEEMHAKGGVVIAAIRVNNPWILTNLEPYCDGLICHFGAKTAAQMDVLTGVYNPTGKLPLTLVSCNEVIAVEWKTLEDGNTYEICVSPNDVPGYDKDQYIDPAILEQVPGGSYAYCDSEGNYYRAWFGLSY